MEQNLYGVSQKYSFVPYGKGLVRKKNENQPFEFRHLVIGEEASFYGTKTFLGHLILHW